MMRTAGPEQKVFAHGFPELLRELQTEHDAAQYGLVAGLYALLRAAGIRITYGETDVLSTHALQFHYALTQPGCAALSFFAPVDTLFRSLNITWKEVTPSGPRTAFQVLRDWIDEGSIALARLKEPLLVYGYKETSVETLLLVSRLEQRMSETILSVSQCDKDCWRYPLDEGNLLIRIEEAPTSLTGLTELTRVSARRAASVWHTGTLAGCATGGDAYLAFSRDLKDPAVSFTENSGVAWLGKRLWSQWAARASSQHFFLRMAPRFGGDQRAAVAKAGFCFGQGLDSWKRFDRLLGPTWDYRKFGFMDKFPAAYLERWENLDLRRRAAKWIDDAAAWEAKAVSELVKLI